MPSDWKDPGDFFAGRIVKRNAQASGNHENIRKWRLKKSLEKTLANRPDMIWAAQRTGLLTAEAEKMIEEITEQVSLKHCKKRRKPKKDF